MGKVQTSNKPNSRTYFVIFRKQKVVPWHGKIEVRTLKRKGGDQVCVRKITLATRE